jgi:hypothetical protein
MSYLLDVPADGKEQRIRGHLVGILDAGAGGEDEDFLRPVQPSART